MFNNAKQIKIVLMPIYLFIEVINLDILVLFYFIFIFIFFYVYEIWKIIEKLIMESTYGNYKIKQLSYIRLGTNFTISITLQSFGVIFTVKCNNYFN